MQNDQNWDFIHFYAFFFFTVVEKTETLENNTGILVFARIKAIFLRQSSSPRLRNTPPYHHFPQLFFCRFNEFPVSCGHFLIP